MNPTPTVFSRMMALFVGSLYLAYLTAVGWALTGVSPWLMSLLVLAGAIAIMAVLVAFGIKADRHRGPVRRFGLATIFLIIVPLSIYLAVIRWVLDEAPSEQFTVDQWIMVLIFSAAFMLLSTVLLLWMAEALMWLAVLVKNHVRKTRQDRRSCKR